MGSAVFKTVVGREERPGCVRFARISATPSLKRAVMHEKREFLFIGFDSTHAAMRAEDVVLDAGLDARLVPRPLPLGGARCGLALRAELQDEKDVRELLEREEIAIGATGTLTDTY